MLPRAIHAASNALMTGSQSFLGYRLTGGK